MYKHQQHVCGFVCFVRNINLLNPTNNTCDQNLVLGLKELKRAAKVGQFLKVINNKLK